MLGRGLLSQSVPQGLFLCSKYWGQTLYLPFVFVWVSWPPKVLATHHHQNNPQQSSSSLCWYSLSSKDLLLTHFLFTQFDAVQTVRHRSFLYSFLFASNSPNTFTCSDSPGDFFTTWLRENANLDRSDLLITSYQQYASPSPCQDLIWVVVPSRSALQSFWS